MYRNRKELFFFCFGLIEETLEIDDTEKAKQQTSSSQTAARGTGSQPVTSPDSLGLACGRPVEGHLQVTRS